jgi:hypothetical protein
VSDIRAGLDGGLAPRPRDREDEEKTTLDQAQRWASLLGAQLAATAVKTLTPPVSDTTSAWHSGAGDLTPSDASSGSAGEAREARAVDVGGAAEAREERMIVRVDGGDLGEVALIVDRKQGAIRVTISAADAGAEAALGLERAGLLAALQSQGITVDSVNVVRASNFGTVLAPPRSNAMQRTREAASAESKDDEHARRRSARKLNLIG